MFGKHIDFVDNICVIRMQIEVLDKIAVDGERLKIRSLDGKA